MMMIVEKKTQLLPPVQEEKGKELNNIRFS